MKKKNMTFMTENAYKTFKYAKIERERRKIESFINENILFMKNVRMYVVCNELSICLYRNC